MMLDRLDQRTTEVLDLMDSTEKLVDDLGVAIPDFKQDVERHRKALLRNEKEIVLAVVSEWGNGKSTLINALLGQRLMPEDIRECTAEICEIKHSVQTYFRVYRNMKDDDKRLFKEELDINAPQIASLLKEYATVNKKDVESQIEKVAIGWPFSLLDNRVTLLDTPGVNSLSETRSQLTINCLPNCHAVLILVDVSKAGTNFDLEFIRNVKNRDIENVFVLVNKVDNVTKGNVDLVLSDLRIKLGLILKEPIVLPVSGAAAFYGTLLKTGVVSLSEILAEVPPSLRAPELNGKEIRSDDPDYADALLQLSNIATLNAVLSDFFERGYGLSLILKRPLSNLKYLIREDVFPILRDQLTVLDGSQTLDEIEREINSFKLLIPKYKNDSDRLELRVNGQFEQTRKAFLSGTVAPSASNSVYSLIENKMVHIDYDELKKNKYASVNSIVAEALKEQLNPESLRRDIENIFTITTADLADILQAIRVDASVRSGPSTGHDDAINELKEEAYVYLRESLVGLSSGAFAAACTWYVATSIATTGILGYGATLPFLASNPVGWAVLAGGAIAALSFYLFTDKSKEKRKSKIMAGLRKGAFIEKAIKEHQEGVESYLDEAEKSLRAFVSNKIAAKIAETQAIMKERQEAKGLREKEIDQKRETIKTRLELADTLLARIETLQMKAQGVRHG